MKFPLIQALMAAMLAMGVLSKAHGEGIQDHLKQNGFINDDTHLDFGSAKEAAERIAADPRFVRSSDSLVEAAGITIYAEKSAPLVSWWVFGLKTGFYPMVVRRRIVLFGNYPDVGSHAEVHTSMLCSASKQACAEIRARFDAMDHVCGEAVPTCKH